MWLVFLGIFLVIAPSAKCQNQVLPPVKEGEPSGLVIIAGAYLYYDQYEELAFEIQRQSPQSLWICLSNNNLGLNQEPLSANDTYIGQCIIAMQSNGMPVDTKIVVVGHSYGAVLANQEISRNPELASGMIIIGATMSDNDFGNTPVPVLVANGDLDGQVRVTRQLESFQNVIDNVNEGDGQYKLYYPHAIIHGVNHCEYTTGAIPELVIRYWINSDVDGDESRRRVALAFVPFISYITSTDSVTIEEAVVQLEDIYLDTLNFMEPLITAFTAEENEEALTSPWAIFSQTYIANVSESLEVTNEVVDNRDFQTIQPSITTADDGTNVQTFAHVYRPTRVIAGEYVGAHTLEVKQKSKQAIEEAIANSQQSVQSGNLCRDINENVFEWVWSDLTPDTQRERYSKQNITYEFQEDILSTTEEEWLEYILHFGFNGEHLEVQSAAFETDTSAELNGGMHHCKLLSPAKAIEFIYVDALYETLYSES